MIPDKKFFIFEKSRSDPQKYYYTTPPTPRGMALNSGGVKWGGKPDLGGVSQNTFRGGKSDLGGVKI